MISVRSDSLRAAWLCLLLACAMLLTVGCTGTTNQPDVPKKQDASVSVPPAEEQRRFVYLCEDLSLLKYQDIAEGLRERCEENGIAYTIVDARGGMEVVMAYIEDLDSTSADAILVSMLMEPLGALIQSKCDAAEIPIFAVSSRMRDEAGQEIPGIEMSAYESGESVAASIADAIEKQRALDMDGPVSVVMCTMSNLTSATEIQNGFYDMFSKRFPELGSDSYVELEVLSPDAEGQYFSLNNYFGKRDSGMQYVFLTFNDDGSAGIVRYVQEVGMDPERILIGAVGMQANSERVFEELPMLATRYHAISVDYNDMGQQAVDGVSDALMAGEEFPHIFMPLGEIVTADKIQPTEAD